MTLSLVPDPIGAPARHLTLVWDRGRPRDAVGVAAALGWRDVMVSGYSDAAQARWLADRGIDLLRSTGRRGAAADATASLNHRHA
jgi:hypothetical protein